MDFYVYGYFDPETDELFYVGKGSEYRDRSHLKPSAWSNPATSGNPFFYYKIKSLMDKGLSPVVKRLYENLTEQEAYSIEHDIIVSKGRRFVDGGTLFNISDSKGGSPKGVSKTRSEEARLSYRKICASKRKANNKDELASMYIDNLMTRKEIAEHYNVSEVLIKKRLAEFGIVKSKAQVDETRSIVFARMHEARECKACKSQFNVVQSSNKVFCSAKCSQEDKLVPVIFKGKEYDSKYHASEVTGYSVGYIMNEFYKEMHDE
jgi:hypothetical protein